MGRQQFQHYRRIKLILGMGGGVLILGATLFSAFSVWTDFHSIRGNADDHAQLLAMTFEEHSRRVFQEVDRALVALTDLAAQAPFDADETHWRQVSLGWIERQPAVRTYWLIDQRGAALNPGRGGIAIHSDFSQHPLYLHHRDNPDRGLHIDGPLRAFGSGNWYIGLSRRLSDPSGAFLGLVMAELRPDFFLGLYNRVDLGLQGALSLFHRNGTLMGRIPHGEHLIGRSFAQTPLFSEKLPASPVGLHRSNHQTRDLGDIIAYRLLPDLPVMTTVEIDEEWAMGGWHLSLYQYLLITGLTLGALLLLIRLVFRQLNRLQEVQQQLEIREEHFRLLAQSATDAVVTLDLAGNIHSWNRGAERLFGAEEPRVLGTSFEKFIPEPYREAHRQGLRRMALGRPGNMMGRTVEVSALHSSGTLFPVEISLSHWRQQGQIYFTGILRDVSERRAYEDQIKKLASHDALTGLPNRTLFLDRLHMAMASAQRNPNKLAVLFIDLDSFKPINDSYGHVVGDRVLQQVAIRLAACVRETDTVARLGGDEFLVLLANIVQPGDAARVCTTILEAVSEWIDVDGTLVDVGCSIGVAVFPDDAKNADHLIQRADTAMYAAKRAGKHGYRFAK